MQSGVAASLIGIGCNILLSAAKIVLGVLCGLVSVTADGINNLSDCGSGAVALVSFCIAGKPADRDHPYGHRRAEYIAAMLTGVLILLVAAELVRASATTIAEGGSASVPWLVYVVLAFSIAVKTGLFFFYRRRAKALSSETLRAASVDSLADCAATAAVLLGMVLTACGLPADGWTGLAVAGFIVWEGVRVIRDAGSELLGRAPDKALTKQLGAIILSYGCVCGFHDLRIFSYGNGISYATVHVEMDAGIPALRSHAILDAIEHEAGERTGVVLTTHLDPIDRTDRAADELKERVAEAAGTIAEGLAIHDFRVVRGAKTKVIFEVSIPFSCKWKDEDVRRAAEAAVTAQGDYIPVVSVVRI